MHGEAKRLIVKPYDQIIQPFHYGHDDIKSTCLWLKNLPLLEPTNITNGRFDRTHLLGWEKIDGKSMSRKLAQKLRSITYDGIAKAMAEQWGNNS